MAVEIFDNVLMEDTREGLYMFSSSTDYQMVGKMYQHLKQDNILVTSIKWTKKEWETSKFIPSICNGKLIEAIDGLVFDSATINLSFPSSIQFPHTHGDCKVLVYYINPDWRNEYYGETIFYNETMSEASKTVLYKPNRAILFDGNTPHSIRPSSHIAPQYRFTLGIFFQQPNFIEEDKK